ncbi:ABC transporter substrate-binding protein [soil metagenome]
MSIDTFTSGTRDTVGTTAARDADTLWYTRCPLPTAFSVAVHTGLLASHLAPLGVAVASLRHSEDPKVRLSHFTHTWPGMMRQGGHIPPLWSRAEGRDVRLIGLSWTREAQLVLALPESRIDSVAALKGKRLAVPRRRNFPIDFWRATVLKGFSDALATADLSLADVTLVDIEVDTIPFTERNSSTATISPPGTAYQTLSSQRAESRALLDGRVDAIFSPGHYGVALRAFIGANTVIDLTQSVGKFRCVNNPSLLAFTVDGRFLDRHPQAVAAALEASLRAAEHARSHPLDVARIVAAESGNAEELVGEIFGSDFAADLAPKLSDDLIEALTLQNHFLQRQGFIPRTVPIEEWIAREPLQQARAKLAGA